MRLNSMTPLHTFPKPEIRLERGPRGVPSSTKVQIGAQGRPLIELRCPKAGAFAEGSVWKLLTKSKEGTASNVLKRLRKEGLLWFPVVGKSGAKWPLTCRRFPGESLSVEEMAV